MYNSHLCVDGTQVHHVHKDVKGNGQTNFAPRNVHSESLGLERAGEQQLD